jgi:hypothetical protein
MTTYTNRYSHRSINTLRGRAHTKKLDTATHTLHPRKFALTVLKAVELHWDVRTERRARQLPSNSKKTNKVKFQKTEQDSLLIVLLHSGLVSCTSKPLCDQFGLLRWHVFLTTPTQTMPRQTDRMDVAWERNSRAAKRLIMYTYSKTQGKEDRTGQLINSQQ